MLAAGGLAKLFEDDKLTPEQRERLKRVISTDQAGRFPAAPAEGHTALFAMLDFDSNYIDAEPIKGNSEDELKIGRAHV